MKPAPKPLSDQVVVITGASSGIGLATARLAAERGAAVLVVSRNGAALQGLVAELRAKGSRADFCIADVADPAQLRAAAAKADEVFGGFDTWINNAGVSIYGAIEDTPLEDQRRLFETNYWGVVQGSLTALDHLRARKGGGALINVGSVLSDQPVPLQGVYSASKHAVKGFTNALRMEARRSAPDVRITLIKPSAIDTPYKEHARNFTGAPATNPPPVYAAALVAEAICYAAEHRTREITVGFGGRALALMGQLVPAVADPLFAALVPLLSRDRGDASGRDHEALHAPGRDSRESAPYKLVRNTSLYTRAQMAPQATGAVLAGAGAVAWAALRLRRALREHRIRRDVHREYLA